ncbi:sigma-54 dependent transcriptional regulator [Ponticaulis sp.]|uniref:sigma-54-dependent transcriptional regulator FlbD n=1 Tax=Ponticaulis sp. TaxID=2020902 RepID=UPI000B75FE00|nr:sigma-54 dependent transcriptional regulator [Ponticaulis sp.]MAI89796.1 sigma-54-dependent Fis family transcriptional regulator [Ponticaulis sp.]OUX99473.1 MAG: sigma-54-dependent Fis family transcriptional regulator [Hyphomonadaceae bacterium TMED5]|tara:strand:+ start:29783 stop:31165 length:1383 start_codon:yes stop_codon:yes gene_type:complete
MRVMMIGNLGGQLSVASKIAFDRGAKVTHFDTVDQALQALRSGKGADLIMADYRLDLGYLTAALDAERIAVPVVACGVEADATGAANAIRSGAREFIPLPPDPDMIAAVLEAVADDERPMIVTDPAMQRVIQLADQIARSDASVLITGESGVGKEVMARYVHKQSKRASKPFISVNCAAIPENLLESELFGHEKGAFTGAVSRRIGKFEEADGGTLLLDEISEMDARLQAKLLRAIQEREIDRVGGSKPIKVNIRILATSNRNLVEAVKEGVFREDLLYRLNVVNLRIPPLRERPQDSIELAEYFVEKYAAANGLPNKQLSNDARDRVQAHDWPGNVRELENAMHRAVLLSVGDEIEADAIRSPDGLEPVSSSTHPMPTGNPIVDAATQSASAMSSGLVGRTVADVEQDLILDTLSHCLGNRTHAANILGISIRTLRNKLKAYSEAGVDVPQPGEVREAI